MSDTPKRVTIKFCTMTPNGIRHFSSRRIFTCGNAMAYICDLPRIPKRGTCLRKLEFDVHELMMAGHDGKMPSITFDMSMHERKMCCPMAECAKKIRNGECRDKYVSEYIGKYFWPARYAGKTR